MPLLPEDQQLHKQILDKFGDIISIVEDNLDLIVAKPHRNNDSSWIEVFKINISRIDELKRIIQEQNDENIKLFEMHGLLGIELKFKFDLIDNTYLKFKKSNAEYETESRLKDRKLVRKWLLRFFSYINGYLTSLSSIIPLAGAVKEFKEFIEHSVGVSQRR
jgi:hypothetical protein